MQPLLDFAGNFWWLIFPLSGVIGGAVKGVSAANERRAQRRLERYRIKQETKVALASAAGAGQTNVEGNRREMVKVLARHNATDERWLSYEIDVAKLLDFPLMTDMRDPLTLGFHKARSRADLLRPASVEAIMARDPLSVGPGELLSSAAAVMNEHKISCLPVVQDGRLVALMTLTDVLDHCMNTLRESERSASG